MDSPRYLALRQWAESARNAGHVVPDDAALAAVAASGQLPPEGQAPASMERWRPTVAFLLKQVAMGVTPSGISVPPHLRAPTGAPLPPAPPQVATAGTRLQRLKVWREQKVAAGNDLAGRITDTELGQLALLLGVGRDGHEQRAKKVAGEGRSLPFLDEIRAVVRGGDGHDDGEAELKAEVQAAPVRPRPRPVTPTPQDTTEPVSPGPDTSLTADGFADYDDLEPFDTGMPLTLTQAADGGLTIEWQERSSSQARVVIYRVVAEDDHEPIAPELSRVVAVVRGASSVLDTVRQTRLLRHYQVWVNQGDSVEDAKRSQPALHASGVLVLPVSHPSVTDDQGRVVGQWPQPPGAVCVRVHRVPVDALQSLTTMALHRFRILPSELLLTGFVDVDPPGGQRYVYRLLVEAVTAGGVTHLSPSVDVEVEVSAKLAAVDDLQIVIGEPGRFDLVWTDPPAGQVLIYRTDKEPPQGSDHRVLPLGSLQTIGLTEEVRLKHPEDHTAPPGQTRWGGLGWPPGWTRMWITPVTVVNGQMIIGQTQTATTATSISSIKLIERVNEQTITFPWPVGAVSVNIHLGRGATTPEQACEGTPLLVVDRDKYVRLGGVHLKLPQVDGTVYIRGVMFDGGRRIFGQPIGVAWNPVMVVRYSLEVKKNLMQKPTHALVRVWADPTLNSRDLDVTGSPPFVCLHNEHHLPLHIADGTPLPVRLSTAPEGSPSMVFRPSSLVGEAATLLWRVDLTRIVGKLGGLRVMAQLPAEKAAQLAVLDPPVSTLRLKAW